jgi:hypothetical protein
VDWEKWGSGTNVVIQSFAPGVDDKKLTLSSNQNRSLRRGNMRIRFGWAFFAIALCVRSASAIPYTEALDLAAVQTPRIENIDKEALVIGNGDLNAILYSRGNEILLNVTKNDVWDSRIDTSEDADLLRVDVKERTWPEVWGAQASWKKNPYPIQVPSCTIKVHGVEGITGAKLDLRRATAEITAASGITRLRTLWHHNVFLVETEGEVSVHGYKMTQLPEAQAGESDGIRWIHQELPGLGDYKGMSVAAAVGRKGRTKVVALVSSHDSATPKQDAITRVQETLARAPEDLVKEHEAGWAGFWAASGVELGIPDFQNWWYRTLYYFRCFSKPGVVAVGLQAGYNGPAGWHGSYKINYNIWQTFWTPFAFNHPELVEPWVEHLYTYLPRARWFAQNAYGCEGAAYHADTWPYELDPTTCRGKNKNQIVYIPWGYTMGMSGMGIQNLWNYWLYRPDRAYLESRIYPVIKEVAVFYASFIEQCQTDEQGKAILGPSYNPEHGPFGTYDNPYDLAYTRYTLEAAVTAAEILAVDTDLVKRFQRSLALLVDYHQTPDPEQDNRTIIADWRDATHDSVKKYNIAVPVVPLFPGDQFSWFSSEEDKALCRRSIQHAAGRYNRNNSVVIINTARARLSLTDDAIRDTQQWFKTKENPNGTFHWQGHGDFMSEQAAVGALINEFLLQSVENIIRVFPAWPADKDASFRNLRTQGGFLVTAEQRDGKITRLEIESTVGGKLRLLSPWPTLKVAKRTLKTDKQGVVELATEAGDKFSFTGR